MRFSLFFICFFVHSCCVFGQDTTRILFVGNSFTYGNNMPQMVKAFADSAQLPVVIAMHAPGGVSVGDIAQGTMAHMNNPALFSLIRSKPWDFVVIQDNQGRFVRDSAQFSTTSLVVQGHMNIRDSVKANNNCAKVILFGGWAFKNGSPPYGNTGIEMIRRILCNYRVLNDTMREVIAPIGEAWIRAVNYLPSVNLWDTDDAHPSYAGSYLTASVIFSTIFELPAKPIVYNGSLAAPTAYVLRAYSDSSLFNGVAHAKYNLCGVKKITPQANGNQVSVAGNFAAYEWYQDNTLVSTAPVLNSPADGAYNVLLTANDGCLVKSCVFLFSATDTGIASQDGGSNIQVYPNPVSGNYLIIENAGKVFNVELFDLAGVKQQVTVEAAVGQTKMSVKGLSHGGYVLLIHTLKGSYRKVIVIGD